MFFYFNLFTLFLIYQTRDLKIKKIKFWDKIVFLKI